LKITNDAVWMNHPKIISCLERKSRPEPRDRNNWVRKLVKGDRMSFSHMASGEVAVVGMPGCVR
jgi:hypothetical protein